MRFTGLTYRAHNPAWVFSPVSGAGAAKYGGRFNPVGTEALYTSLSDTGAIAEYQQGFSHRPQPTMLCAYDVDCADIVDLTDSDEQNTRHITLSDLASPWESQYDAGSIPTTWEIVSTLLNEGVAGIIVSSFANNAPPHSKNLVLWDWDDTPPHQIMLIDDNNRMPHNQLSWIKY
ncbi:MAG: RES domain-containing protein [Gammaproteobacteria bacterium]|nr:RES domain-containing protein [Gammaproteobacteria bacterium]